MSRLEQLLYNLENYKNTCNVFEESSDTCYGCLYRAGEFNCVLPVEIYDRSILNQIIVTLTRK